MTDMNPRFDDRTFQDLVDEAKRLIPRFCPEWTNHAPTDPGIALIEIFAWMTDQLISRLNEVPRRAFESFVGFLGVEPFPARPARVEVTFLVAASATNDDVERAGRPDVVIPVGTAVATITDSAGQVITFETEREGRLGPAELASLGTTDRSGRYTDRSLVLDGAPRTAIFEACEPGESLVMGLTSTQAGRILALDLSVEVDGLGVDPRHPPVGWEALTSEGWAPVEVLDDTTMGLGRPGRIVLQVPDRHEQASVGGIPAWWLRLRLLEPFPGQPMFMSSPWIDAISVQPVGCTVPATHCSTKRSEYLGTSDGTPGQVFRTSQHPVLLRRPDERVEVTAFGETVAWSEVSDFSRSGPDDEHYTMSSTDGTIRFGPALYDAWGERTQRGAVPPSGATLQMTSYRVGGGAAGNVGAGTVTTLHSTVPYVDRVENRRPSWGGTDAETPENWRERAQLWLRTGERAVTRADYERIAMWAHPDVARAGCVQGDDARNVHLVLVPRVPPSPRFEDFLLSDELFDAVESAISERRIVGTSVSLAPPLFQGTKVRAVVRAQFGTSPFDVRNRCTEEVIRLLHPVHGGSSGAGWPFGRDISTWAVAAALAAVDGVDDVLELELFATDPITGESGATPAPRIGIGPSTLPYLTSAEIMVARAEEAAP